MRFQLLFVSVLFVRLNIVISPPRCHVERNEKSSTYVVEALFFYSNRCFCQWCVVRVASILGTFSSGGHHDQPRIKPGQWFHEVLLRPHYRFYILVHRGNLVNTRAQHFDAPLP